MTRYATWIKSITPSGTFAIGADAYRARLRYEDALDMPLDQYLAVGERALEETRAQFVATAKQIDPNATPQQVYASITQGAPAAGRAARHRDERPGETARLRRSETTGHAAARREHQGRRDAALRALDDHRRRRLARSARNGRDAVVLLRDARGRDVVGETARGVSGSQFNDFGFPIISAHEVYPGHFTNFSIDRQLDLSLTRKLSTSSEFAEGWAHYSEQMMVDEGWGNGDPRVRLAQLDEALLRECRYIAGVKLHTEGMTLEQAEALFTDQCFQTPQVAEEESLRGTQDPMYGYYTLGKLMILKLRDDYQRKVGSEFTLQRFHDELLSRGDPPIPLLRPFILGHDDDGRPL